MPSDGTRLALMDIRDNAVLAQDFVAGSSLAAFKSDRRTFYAVTRCLEIISEAARRLSQDLRDRHPDLPWRAIMGAGNIYQHDYDNVEEEFVWLTVELSLAPLLAAVEAELARLPKLGSAPKTRCASRWTASSTTCSGVRPRKSWKIRSLILEWGSWCRRRSTNAMSSSSTPSPA